MFPPENVTSTLLRRFFFFGTCNLDVHVAIQQQILCFQVPVDDVAVMTILHRRQDLPKLPPGLQLTETPMLCQVVCNHRRTERDRAERWCVMYKPYADNSLHWLVGQAYRPFKPYTASLCDENKLDLVDALKRKCTFDETRAWCQQ